MNEMSISFKRLVELCLTQSNKMIISIILSVISFTISIIPYYMIYRIILELTTVAPSMNQITVYSIFAFISILARVVLFALATSTSHKAAFTILHQLRMRLAKKLLSLPLGYFVNKSLGETKKTINEDVEKLEIFIAHNIPEVIGSVTLPIVTTIFMFFMDWRMALATIAIIPLLFFFYGLAYKDSKGLLSKYTALLIKMNSSIIEYTNGMQVIKSFGLTASSYKKLSNACVEYGDFEASWGKATYKYFNVVEILVLSGVVTIFPIGLLLYINESLSMSIFILFLLLGLGYSQPLLKLAVFAESFSQIAAGEKEIHKILTEDHLPIATEPKEPTDHTIEFKNVSFSYEERPILSQVSFVAKQNEITALIGPSGAGKTTIAKLIPRFWDIEVGEIKIGGVNIKQIPPAKLMEMVSFVFQDVFLYSVSIKDNISFGRESASDEEIISASKAAMCHDFISKLPDGYNTPAGQRGTKLSGGEKQRIALARAIIKDAPIIVLDEATSATDPENEDKIQEAISKMIKNKTVIVIAHNLSTIVDVNKILLVDNGQIKSSGKHSILLEQSDAYKEMWEIHKESNKMEKAGGNSDD